MKRPFLVLVPLSIIVCSLVVSRRVESDILVSSAAPPDAAPAAEDTTGSGIAPESATQPESETALADSAEVEALKQARVSLVMRDAPLSQVIKLLTETTPASFHYGAPPDMTVSPALKDELLLPGIYKMLRGSGWQMKRDETDLFIFPRNTPASPTATCWSVWEGKAPPRGWLAPPGPKVRLQAGKSAISSSRVISPAPSSLPQDGRWRLLSPSIGALRRPALEVRAIPSAGAKTPYLRWKLTLRFVPAGTRLLLETNAPATFYVNGAPLLHNWSGLKMIDISRTLHRGENVLAVVWPQGMSKQVKAQIPVAKPPDIPRPDATLPDEASPPDSPPQDATPPVAEQSPAFLLRYEWLLESEPGSTAVSQADENG